MYSALDGGAGTWRYTQCLDEKHLFFPLLVCQGHLFFEECNEMQDFNNILPYYISTPFKDKLYAYPVLYLADTYIYYQMAVTVI